jgi:hypothetical protein
VLLPQACVLRELVARFLRAGALLERAQAAQHQPRHGRAHRVGGGGCSIQERLQQPLHAALHSE